jgi:dipeptidyl-peptidase-4
VTYTSTELSPLSRAKYSVHLNGKGKHRLGNEPSAPADGDPRQFFTIPLDGDLSLNAWMLTPEGFDPAEGKKYPVLMTQYSGPGSQSVAFTPISRSDMVIYKPLLDAGIVVVCVDGRGTGGRGEAFKKCTYANLGHIETRDQIAAARHFASQPWVDEARIGIYGWSFGGFIALNAILHGADIFSVAVAVAPVTNWRLYDSIYTEIYNGLPADNAGGYDNNSPTNHAALLRGKLLLIHGSADDNVHVQNTLTMARALIDADRDFDMLIYPDDNHNMMPHSRLQVRHRIADYIIENL